MERKTIQTRPIKIPGPDHPITIQANPKRTSRVQMDAPAPHADWHLDLRYPGESCETVHRHSDASAQRG
jgi:hypothetical protein